MLGGGYVGVEFAQAFRRFGSQVTVLEFGTQLLGREDPDVAAAVLTMFEEDGIDVVLGAETQVVEGRSGDAVRLRVKTPAGDRTIEGSDILVAAGRTPNTREIGLEEAGIELDARGFVKVDDRLQDNRRRRLGGGRVRRQPAVHARGVRRLSGRARQPRGESAEHPRSADPLLRLHRS